MEAMPDKVKLDVIKAHSKEDQKKDLAEPAPELLVAEEEIRYRKEYRKDTAVKIYASVKGHHFDRIYIEKMRAEYLFDILIPAPFWYLYRACGSLHDTEICTEQ